MKYAAIRKSKVVNDLVCFPRPKITQTVLKIGTEQECFDLIESIRMFPENESTEDIEVELYVKKYDGQKTGTSSRPNNGRNQKT